MLTTKDTTTAPTVEDALSQASLLVNGGGLGQLETVTKELNAALGGREDTFRDLLQQTQLFLTQANGTTADVDRALRGLADVSAELQRRQDVIDAALRDLRPAAKVLREDTPDLTALLREVEQFARSADHLVGPDPRASCWPRSARSSRCWPRSRATRRRTPSRWTPWSGSRSSLDSVVPGDYLSTALDLHIDGVTLPDLGRGGRRAARRTLGGWAAPARGHAAVRGWPAMSGFAAVFRNRLYLSALGVLMVFVVGIAYLFASVLDEPLTSRPDQVTVELSATGGLFEGSAVTYRGVKVGKVTSIVATSTGAEATVSLAGDARGAARRAGPGAVAVAGGGAVPRLPAHHRPRAPTSTTATGSPPTPPTSRPACRRRSLAVGKVLDQIDARKLRRLLVALSTGLGGTGEDLGNLLDQGQAVLTDLDRAWPQTERLLRNSGPVLDIPVDSASDLRSLARSSRELAAFLRDYDPELRATLRRTPDEIKQLRALVNDVADVLPGFLGTALPFTDEFVTHDPHLRALLQSYAPGLGTLTDVIRNGELRLALIPDLDARCRYDIARRDPRDPTRRQLQDNGALLRVVRPAPARRRPRARPDPAAAVLRGRSGRSLSATGRMMRLAGPVPSGADATRSPSQLASDAGRRASSTQVVRSHSQKPRYGTQPAPVSQTIWASARAIPTTMPHRPSHRGSTALRDHEPPTGEREAAHGQPDVGEPDLGEVVGERQLRVVELGGPVRTGLVGRVEDDERSDQRPGQHRHGRPHRSLPLMAAEEQRQTDHEPQEDDHPDVGHALDGRDPRRVQTLDEVRRLGRARVELRLVGGGGDGGGEQHHHADDPGQPDGPLERGPRGEGGGRHRDLPGVMAGH